MCAGDWTRQGPVPARLRGLDRLRACTRAGPSATQPGTHRVRHSIHPKHRRRSLHSPVWPSAMFVRRVKPAPYGASFARLIRSRSFAASGPVPETLRVQSPRRTVINIARHPPRPPQHSSKEQTPQPPPLRLAFRCVRETGTGPQAVQSPAHSGDWTRWLIIYFLPCERYSNQYPKIDHHFFQDEIL